MYKHFAGKEELALYLFETCHRRLWTKCHTAIVAAKTFEAKLEGYVGKVLELVDEDPEAMAFLSDSARPVAKSRTDGPAENHDRPGPIAHERSPRPQGTLAEIARMIQVGAVPGPAVRWKTELVALFRRVAAA